METSDILKKVRKIEIKTRGLSSQVFAGQYHSAFKGRGMAFSEVREYQYGDDVRDIDWNVTARFHRPYVKVFEEERELTVMLLVDVSGSLDFGTQTQMKRDMVTEIAATIAFKRTNVTQAIEFMTSVQKRRTTAFILSDFYVRENFLHTLQICNRKHDVVAIQVYDPRARELPNVGLMKVVDAETGFEQYVDTGSKSLRQAYSRYWMNRQKELQDTFTRSNVDNVSIATNEDFVKQLLGLFKQRS